MNSVNEMYELAKKAYAELGVDTDAVIEKSKTDKNLFLVDIGKIINDVV